MGLLERKLVDLIIVNAPHATGNHDGLTITSPFAEHALLIGSEIANKIGAAKLIVK